MSKDSLTRFANVLYSEALEEKERVAKELQSEQKETLAKTDNELKIKFEREFEAFRTDLEHEMRLSLSRREAELSRTLRQNRAREADEVFLEVTDRLIAFTKEPSYERYLFKSFSDISSNFNEGKTVCSAKQCDLELIKKICPIKNIEFETADDEIIGGFTLKNTGLGIFADCTLKSRLDEEKTVFFQTSGLSID